jgi:hypothetical protein
LPDIVTATRHLVAVQAQSWQGALLTLANRVAGATARDVESLVASGDLVVSWINRGTLHLVHRDDFDWLHALMAPPKANALRYRLARLGMDEKRGDELVNTIVELVTDHGTTTKDEIALHLKGRGFHLDALTTAQLLETAAQRRLLVRGPMQAAEATYVIADSWIGRTPQLPDHAELLQQLVRRYCASHWPAAPADLAAWSGLPLGAIKRAWTVVSPEGPEPHLTAAPSITQLLGPFDPVLHGWPDRQWLLGDHVDRVITTNGIFKSMVVVNNRGVGTWKWAAGQVTLDLFADVDAAGLVALANDNERVAAFLTAM